MICTLREADEMAQSAVGDGPAASRSTWTVSTRRLLRTGTPGRSAASPLRSAAAAAGLSNSTLPAATVEVVLTHDSTTNTLPPPAWDVRNLSLSGAQPGPSAAGGEINNDGNFGGYRDPSKYHISAESAALIPQPTAAPRLRRCRLRSAQPSAGKLPRAGNRPEMRHTTAGAAGGICRFHSAWTNITPMKQALSPLKLVTLCHGVRILDKRAPTCSITNVLYDGRAARRRRGWRSADQRLLHPADGGAPPRVRTAARRQPACYAAPGLRRRHRGRRPRDSGGSPRGAARRFRRSDRRFRRRIHRPELRHARLMAKSTPREEPTCVRWPSI